MPIVAVLQGGTLTRELYDATIPKMTGGKPRMESAADWPVAGLLVHVTGETEQGFRIIDVWESEEAFGRFAEAITPILEEAGIKNDVETYEVHTLVRS